MGEIKNTQGASAEADPARPALLSALIAQEVEHGR